MKNQEALKQQGDVIWNIANLLRGPYRPPQYRRVMIPLTVLRRLDCALEATKDEVLAYYQHLLQVGKYNEETIEKMINRKFGLNFRNTIAFTFQRLLGDADKLAANQNHFIAGFSGNARKILEKFKFDEEIEKLDEATRLFDVVKEVAAVDLHPNRISNIEMGYLFEDLVRRFNEQANEEAGDHFTPREVIKLMVKLLFTHDDPVYREGKVIKIYGPTGGMLSESDKLIADPETGLNPDANLELFGQEYNPESYAICGSDLMIKGEDVKSIVYGNTLGTGKPKEGFTDGDGHPDERFHFMLANPPFGVEWKPEKDHVTKEHTLFGFKGRFGPGLPRINDGALLFLLHMISKMQPAPAEGGEGSRIAVVFNGSPLFTGDAGSGESNIRRWIIENDMLEAVIGLPDQLFYNTGIATYIWIVTNRKNKQRQGKVQLINGTEFARKMKKSLGDKRKRLGDGTDGQNDVPDGSPDHIATLVKLYGDFAHDQRMRLTDIQTNIDPKRDQTESMYVSKVFNNADFGYLKITVERPLRLNFELTDERIGRVRSSSVFTRLAISRKRVDKMGIQEDLLDGQAAQAAILEALHGLQATLEGRRFNNREVFEAHLSAALDMANLPLDTGLKAALLAPGALGDKDPSAEPCRNKKGELEPDADLRDTETVPLPAGIALPLPLEYENKKNKGKLDLDLLLQLVRQPCEDYLKAEVLPYRPDAWIDHQKTKIGFEIPFNRHFYEYKPPRPLAAIEQDIADLERDIVALLKEVTA
jgi:type I restriction enzyme M protein